MRSQLSSPSAISTSPGARLLAVFWQQCPGRAPEPAAGGGRQTGVDTLLTRGARCFPAGGGLAWLRVTRSGPGLAASLGIAAAAAAGCSSTAATGPAQTDSRHLPVGRPCSARPGWAAITLTDTSSTPMVTVPPGGHLVVTVPRWGWGTATDVHPARAGILREQCTVLLPGHGRRTIFLTARPGSTWLGATVQPASNLMMPAWSGKVTVRSSRS
jgi:hypothetical protein